jgi:phosphatidylglycerophosphatase A
MNRPLNVNTSVPAAPLSATASAVPGASGASPAPAPRTGQRPSFRFLLSHPAHMLALGFGSGLPRGAPGTWGTATGWVLYIWLSQWLSTPAWWALVGATLVVGAWAAQRTGRDLGDDSGHIVIDEIVAFWIVLLMLPADSGLPMQALAFLLFRLFDIVKPPPIRWLDARIKNGFGVMLDDLAAAFYALLALSIALRVMG